MRFDLFSCSLTYHSVATWCTIPDEIEFPRAVISRVCTSPTPDEIGLITTLTSFHSLKGSGMHMLDS